MKRSDQAKIRTPIKPPYFVMAVVSLQEDDRFPSILSQPPIDPCGFRLHCCHKLMVSLDVSTAGCANLHESERTLISRIAFQESLDRQKTFQNSLGVIDPVNSHPEKNRIQTEILEQSLPLIAG